MMLFARCVFASFLCLVLAGAGGCAAVGFVAAAMPPPNIEAAYKDLGNHTVAVMVWADRTIRIDFENIQPDLAYAVQKRLQTAAEKDKVEGLANIRWVDARRVWAWQQNYPDTEGLPAEELAKTLKVERLIYIEVNDFQTRAESTVELFRGSMNVSIRVVEVNGAEAKISFADENINAVYPPSVPEDGTPKGNDATMYYGTLQLMSLDVANRFMKHTEEE